MSRPCYYELKGPLIVFAQLVRAMSLDLTDRVAAVGIVEVRVKVGTNHHCD
jgi:hypothetical protein